MIEVYMLLLLKRDGECIFNNWGWIILCVKVIEFFFVENVIVEFNFSEIK